MLSGEQLMKQLRVVFMTFLSLLALTGCDFSSFTALLAPTNTPTPAPPSSQIVLTTDTTAVRVGEIITVQMQVMNLGMPLYTISLTPGESLRVLYSGDSAEVVATAAAPVFEIVSTVEEIQAGQIRLRAIAPGEALLSVYVSGEASARQPGTDHYVFYWSNASSSIELTAAR
jgi:hypothetical protein